MKIKSYLTPVLFFAAANLMMGAYSGLYDPSFNNYLAQVHHIGEVARGGLEFPRELPGFLMVFIFTALLFLKDTRIAITAAAMVGISLWGQGFLAPDMFAVVVWMLVWSTGAHLFMVMKSSLALRLAEKGHAGRLLGKLGAIEAGGLLVGMLAVYLGSSRFNLSFSYIFAVAGSCAFAAAILLYFIQPERIQRPARNLLVKRRYFLFYVLNMLFGARKQIFLTFAPWVLIKLFHAGVDTFALLGLIGTTISLVFRPLLGRAIDYWGEKTVLLCDSAVIITICVLYGFSQQWFSAPVAIYIIMACYIIDQLLFATSMARITYLNRIAESPDDIAPTISLGLTLDHAISMTVPIGGGLLWACCGYQWVFAVAAFIAVSSGAASLFIPGIASPGHQQDVPDNSVL